MIKLFTDQYNSVKSIFVKRFYRNQAFVSISLLVTSRSPLLKVQLAEAPTASSCLIFVQAASSSSQSRIFRAFHLPFFFCSSQITSLLYS